MKLLNLHNNSVLSINPAINGLFFLSSINLQVAEVQSSQWVENSQKTLKIYDHRVQGGQLTITAQRHSVYRHEWKGKATKLELVREFCLKIYFNRFASY